MWRHARSVWLLSKSVKLFPRSCFPFDARTVISSADVSFDNQAIQNHLDSIKYEHAELMKQQLRAKGDIDRLREIKPIVSLLEEIEKIKADIKELDMLKQDFADRDQEFKNAICEEYNTYTEKINSLHSQIIDLLVPPDYIDSKDLVLEISAGVGGKEAMLFARDLFHMYCRYAEWKGWKCNILEYDEIELGGLRSGSISISGSDAGKYLKFEGGVHRVQRVPKTERHSLVHTSTAALAVLPEPSEIEILLDPKDLIIETKRSSGAGGQHVNTTDSCVRITHIPTGIIVERQTERSQHLNKEKALKALRMALYQRMLQNMESKQRFNRKLQVGTGARSEKVRTYNFIQNRITDHRIGESIFGIGSFLEGKQKLDQLITMLLEASRLERLQEILGK